IIIYTYPISSLHTPITINSIIIILLSLSFLFFFFFFFNDTAPTEIYTLSLHDALPICGRFHSRARGRGSGVQGLVRLSRKHLRRSEEHTSELQSRGHLVCRLLLEKKKKK